MNKNFFLDGLKETLELEGVVNENTVLHLTSLAILTIIVFVDENFDKQIKASDLKKVNSVFSLMELIGLERFE